MNPIVVKVGGSLYGLADLRARLHALLASVAQPVLIVPGGGPTTDVIRDLDRVHRLGAETSHWLALQACSINGHFLATLLGNVPVVAQDSSAAKIAIVDLARFAADDERRADHWPHEWDVTSDSMAVRVAKVVRAPELVLLKSIDIDATADWKAAAAKGVVDPFFPIAIERMPELAVKVVNLRTRRAEAL
jgi:aspartokinase-like uncharacterized kinase